MNKAILGLIISIIANGIYAARNFFEKKTQLFLTGIATAIWLLEYFFIFHSSTYTLIMSFTLLYLIAYHYRLHLLRFFKLDFAFLLMILMIVLASLISIKTYEGVNSIFGIVIMFLDLFAAYMFTSQGLRYKNAVVSIMYVVLDYNLANYFVAALDVVNLIVPILTLMKHLKEKPLDTEGLKEYYELIKVTKEARKLRSESIKKM